MLAEETQALIWNFLICIDKIQSYCFILVFTIRRYHHFSELHIKYACIIWGQSISTINRLYILWKKALKIINFKAHNAHSSPLFHYSKIIKIADKVNIESCLFINKYIPIIYYLQFLLIGFTFSSKPHNYQTLFACKGNLQISSVQTTSYRKKCFFYMIIRTWNDIHKEMKGPSYKNKPILTDV